MDRESVGNQLKHHVVAIISLVIAITALLYNTWRDEATERNRNVRAAAFELMRSLEQLQLVVNSVYFQDKRPQNPIMGWSHVAMIGDLAKLVPSPVPETVDVLVKDWKQNAASIGTNEAAVTQISQDIDSSRDATLKVLLHLH